MLPTHVSTDNIHYPIIIIFFFFSLYFFSYTIIVSTSAGNLTATPSSYTTLYIVASGTSGLVTVTVSASPAGVVQFDSPTATFNTGGPTTGSVIIRTLNPSVAGKVTLSFSLDNNAEYTAPPPVVLYVFSK